MTGIRWSLLVAIAAGLFACGKSTAPVGDDGSVLNIYNWADYIGSDTIERFEAEYGIKVNYDFYDSAEVIDVKLLSGNTGYDVVVHSNQYSSRLAPIGIYEELDFSRLPNAKNLDPVVLERIYAYEAVRGYTVPYHWGSTGYTWNEELVRERLPDHPMDSADVLFDPEVVSKLADCGVSLLDGPAELVPMVLAYLGRDPNAVDAESLAAAEEQIRLVRPYIRYFSNQKMIYDLPNREVCVAMGWSGDFAQASALAEDVGVEVKLRYTIPKEGSGLWVDGLFIPADAPHKDNAYLFIDFLLRADIAADIVNDLFIANANRASWQLIDREILDNPAMFPDEASWNVMFPITAHDPALERDRTRAFARAKAGL